MLLEKESSWKISLKKGLICINERTYSSPIIMSLKGIEVCPEEITSLSHYWARKPISGQIFILASNGPFERARYDAWASWAHSNDVGFDKVSLEGLCKTVPFMQIERRCFRILILPPHYDDRIILPPVIQERKSE